MPGYISKHNSNYWKREKYLGLGPSAHSYNGGKRQWNLSNNRKYIQALSNKELCFEMEELSLQDKLNEYIMMSLRTKWGVDLAYLQNNFGSVVLATFNKECMKFIDQLLLKEDNGKIFVTGTGKLVLDKITSDLFQVDSKKEKII
jgi:oxygen-independent coproporphyrinogen-3 oxidase